MLSLCCHSEVFHNKDGTIDKSLDAFRMELQLVSGALVSGQRSHLNILFDEVNFPLCLAHSFSVAFW